MTKKAIFLRLNAEELEALKRKKVQTGAPIAELIRRAIRQAYMTEQTHCKR